MAVVLVCSGSTAMAWSDSATAGGRNVAAAILALLSNLFLSGRTVFAKTSLRSGRYDGLALFCHVSIRATLLLFPLALLEVHFFGLPEPALSCITYSLVAGVFYAAYNCV
eukprot:Sspe_Gene.103693::Locus_79533_Transcript_1_1_Confidence_1.000_Length_329::g.103693::m.103693